ncbi:MAG: hypothetical protein ACXVHX_26740 [Solirubrobacteraceae bacterium]
MTTVIVPWRGGCPHRERAWRWVQAQYALKHPDWRVVEAAAPDGPWCKATAATPAIEAADDGVVIVADADVWCDGLAEAVHAVASGLAAWAIPHFLVKRLTEECTAWAVMGDDAPDWYTFDQQPYRGLMGGGFVIARRETLLDCPLDPRFVGWGQEDASWAVALHTLHGAAWRGTDDLIHLWHPPQSRMNRKTGSIAGQQLHRRYLAARRDPAAMRALTEEARLVTDVASHAALHGDSPPAGRDV